MNNHDEKHLNYTINSNTIKAEDLKEYKDELKKAFHNDDVIDEVPEKSIEQIIREVALEENMTEEEVMRAVEKLTKLRFSVEDKKRHTKAKKDSAKVKAKRKNAKKARKRNR